jgi:outer membrane receptor for ferrienterochelin and colicins
MTFVLRSVPELKSRLFRAISGAAFAVAITSVAASAQSGTISGRVTVRVSGEPLSDATLSASRAGGGFTSTKSAADGAYRFTNLAAGTYTVSVTARIGLTPRIVDDVVVRAGETTTLALAMSPVARQLEQVVTTATGGAQPERIQDSPNPISVVTASQIAERPSATFADHLKSVPGLSISTGGIAQANIVSRGFNNAFSPDILMLQDYRYASVPALRVNIPLLVTGTNEDIDRIEVLQGPAAAIYGPNSGNGVLHVITKSPFQSAGTTVTVDGGERSLVRASVRNAGIFAGNKLAYKLSGEYLTATDFTYTDPNEPSTYPTTDTRIPVERRGQPVAHDLGLRKSTGEARLDYHPTENTQLITTGGYTLFGRGRDISTNFGAAEARNWSYLNLQERLHHKDFFAQVFYDRSNSGNSNPADPTGTYFLRTGIPIVDRSSILAGQVQQGLRYGPTRMVIGGEYLATRPQTDGTTNGRNESRDDINEYGGYLQTTTSLLPKLDFLAAARVDANSRINGSQFSPRAALILKPNSSNTFRLTFNRAYGSPPSIALFLDQYTGSTPAPGMPVQILGNPAKEGWMFNRSCSGAVGALCMRSPYVPGVVGVSAASAYAGFLAPSAALGGLSTLEAIIKAAPASAFAGGETARQQLLSVVPMIRGLRPTDAAVGSVLFDLVNSTPLTSTPGDYAPLGATFANTWEGGYKGFLGKRLGLSVDAWFQKRPAEPTAQVINPAVLFNGPQLGAYLGANITAGLIAQGVPLAQAQAQGEALAGGLAAIMAKVPVGAAAFTNSLYDQPYLVASYRAATGSINVHGVDVATDLLLDGGWSVAATYSNLNRNVFSDAPGATLANPLAANTPKHRATATLRYENQVKRYSAEVRGRYADAFPVNSGVLNSYNIGTPVPYAPVPVNALLDAGVSWVVPFAGSPRWSLNATNLLDNRVATFVGVPKIGRLIMTRVQYQY